MSPSFPNVEKETAVAMAATDGKSSAAPSDFNDGDARLSSFSSDPKIKTMQNSVDPETASSSLSGCVKNLEVVDLVGCSSSDSDAVGLNRSIEPRKDMRVVSNGRSELAIHHKGSVSVGHGSPGVAVGIVINGSIERAAAESGKGNSSNGTVVGGIGAEAGNVHIIFQVQPEPSGLDLRTEMVDAANEKESVGKIESAVEASTKKDDNPQNKDPDKALSLTPSAFGGNKSFEASSATFQKRVASLQFDQPPTKKAKEKEGFDPQTSIGGEKVISETVAPPRPSIATAEREQSDSIVPTINNPVLPAEKDAVHPPSVSLVKQGHDSESDMPPECDPFFASIVDLSPIPNHDPLPVLRPRDVAELESALHIGDKYKHSEDGGWREDWSGNLQLVDKEIVMNRGQIAQDPQIRVVTLPFVEWSAKVAGVNPNDFRGVHLLFSYVHHMKGTPPMAQRILAHSLCRPAKTVDGRLKYIVEGVRRISYDPTVLTQDGWTTAKAKSPDGASGGAFLIGRRVIWHRYEAIVIAFVRDEEIGDLWKAMWIEDHDTFDLEADELQDALKKWERKEVLRQKKLAAGRQTLSGTTAKPQGLGKQGISGPRSAGSMRFAASSNLTVKGIEHGIILASPTHPNARPGVPWPARVMHVSEVKALTGSQLVSRRSSSKNIIHVVFLAPYWNGGYAFSPKKNAATTLIDPLRSGSVAATAQNPFSTGILFEMETIEVSDSTIKNYPFDLSFGSLSPDKLSAQFRFIGLPKAAFPRYLASHRLAMAFKAYARQDLAKSPSPNDSEGVQSHAGAFAALTETHPLSVRTKIFPQAALDLPFEYILSGLPDPFERSALSQNPLSDGDEALEKVLDIHAMLQLLTPPTCWGVDYTGKNLKDKKEKCIRKVKRSTKMAENTPESPRSNHNLSQLKSPDSKSLLKVTSPINDDKESGVESSWSLKNFASEYLLGMIGMGSRNEEGVSYKLSHLGEQLSRLVGEVQQKTISADKLGSEERVEIMRTLLHWCLATKGHGEDFLFCDATFLRETNTPRVVVEWRKACERIYRRVVAGLSITGFGDGTTCVLTDFRCNQHITASGSFERAVRLPAALKGARMAGAGMKETIPLVSGIDDKYVQLAESKILTKAHKASYLKRIKAKINSLPPEAKGMPLTDDSDGEGGEDTSKLIFISDPALLLIGCSYLHIKTMLVVFLLMT